MTLDALAPPASDDALEQMPRPWLEQERERLCGDTDEMRVGIAVADALLYLMDFYPSAKTPGDALECLRSDIANGTVPEGFGS